MPFTDDHPVSAAPPPTAVEATIANTVTALSDEVRIVFADSPQTFTVQGWEPIPTTADPLYPTRGDRALAVQSDDGDWWLLQWDPQDRTVLPSGPGSDVATHSALKTGVHGIPSMTTGHGLVWDGTGWVSTDVATQAELNTEATARATVATNLATHAALTTGAHGGIVASTDPRLTDTRTPTDGSVTNAKVNAAAAIALSKLNLTGYTGAATITTLGTVTTGVWNAGAVTSSANGSFNGGRFILGIVSGNSGMTVGLDASPITVYRTSANQLTVTNVANGFIVNALRVDPSAIGFFGITPAARPAAYTQTYSTTSRTHAAYTADAENVAYTGAADGEAKLADLNALRVAVENLRAGYESTSKVVNQMLDDLQAFGLLQ